jgi:poly-gamma-glutamate biosynthesis protein PgsC/CapC
MVEAAVGLGVIISLLFNELLGASAGGIVVPGYIAMYLDHPMQIIGTLLVSLLTLGVIKIVSMVTLLYGKRRMVLAILFGFIFGWLSRNLIFGSTSIYDLNLQSIGYIIPGLIANWMERQGVVKTISVMLIAAVIVRLILTIISGGEVNFNV